jgi:uncharacterized protein (DUF983 family)
MTDQHCPGFESNKTLNEVKIKCPECGKECEIFSDEMNKNAKCAACGITFDPKNCLVPYSENLP